MFVWEYLKLKFKTLILGIFKTKYNQNNVFFIHNSIIPKKFEKV